MKKHNFSAGPSILSEFTIKNTAEGILDLNYSGLSVMEISHRSPEFQAIMDESVQLFKELLNVPDTHEVLFLQGGANLQFSMIPFNLLKAKAGYLVTGSWASKAYKEATIIGQAVEVASSKDKNYSYLPKGYDIPADLDYFHITTNNTIYGTEIKEDIDSPVPLVADASSDIFSRPMDVSKYGLIYGGAQKNLGPAGLAFVIVKKDLLGKTGKTIPTYLDYQVHIDKGSMYNTPPCVAIFASLQTLKWYKQMGGIEEMHKVNLKKAALLYDEIDRNSLFKCTVPNEGDRSIMNVTFVMNEGLEEKEKDFLELTKSKGIVGIKGHRSVGGFRASIYNAMPEESIQVLIDAMKEFEQNA